MALSEQVRRDKRMAEITKFSLGGLLSGAFGGFLAGGPIGAIGGGLAGGFGPEQMGPAIPAGLDPSQFGSPAAQPIALAADPCTPPLVPAPGGGCFFPGSPAAVDVGVSVATGGAAVQGAFGMPATTPSVESRTMRRCPRRMVLGFDNLCYPKVILPRRSKFRKWRGARRATLSVRDEMAIRRAASAKDRVLKLAKEAGLHASKSRPAPRAKHAPHIHGGVLKVIAEESN